MKHSSERYLEDFAVGQTFGSGRLRIDKERTLAFAAEFEPLAVSPPKIERRAAASSRVEGLRIEFGGERERPLLVDAQPPRTKRLPYCKIFQVALARLCHDLAPALADGFERERDTLASADT